VNKLPAFDESGYLPKGTHQYSVQEFIKTFCDSPGRSTYAQPFEELAEWVLNHHGTSLVIGGTFVTSKSEPGDLDVLLFFKNKSDVQLPDLTRSDDGSKIDVQILAEEEVEVVQAYLQLFAADKRDIARGLAQVKLHPGVVTHEVREERSIFFDVALAGYRGRAPFFSEPSKRLVIPIHGIRSDAEWVARFTLRASMSGWAVAPFLYGNQPVTVLRDKDKKKALVREFRLWIDEIRKMHDGPISIVAHSFGTYLVGRYLSEAGDLIAHFEGVILAGSILSTEFSWGRHLDNETVRMVLNTRSLEDEWVKYLPDGGVRYLAEDPLMGKAAVTGFTKTHPRLLERKSGLLTHANMFEADVINGLWLPFLEMARRSHSTSWKAFSDPDPKPD
jgi:pimeloyl-ACP methyl ester carboxylesterase